MILIWAHLALATDGYFMIGYGAKAIGVGGAGVAFPQDRLAGAVNPAGMALVPSGYDAGLRVITAIREASVDCRGIGACDAVVEDRSARTFRDDHDTHVVILTGTLRAFSAGADLKEIHPPMTFAEQRQRSDLDRHLCRTWEEMPQTTIAAIEGPTVGAGVAITLCCDWRVMSRSAYLYVPAVKIGLTLQWQAIPRLVALVGPARAKRIVMLCEKMGAEQALAWGLVEEIADDGQAMELARAAPEMPPVIMTMAKQAINATANAKLHASSFMDADVSLLVLNSDAAKQAREVCRGDSR
ncbi:MAG: enoyl-CoA hydratase/isomerase family protein [Pseudomonadota bacterium]|nr:enoyl-CoA hydratase/isomerase family protein [Pseudomonadota bacterium]